MVRKVYRGRLISSSEIEKWAYCPLSWKLSREAPEEEKEELKEGMEVHTKVEEDLKSSMELRRRSSEEYLSFRISMSTFLLLFLTGITLAILVKLGRWKNLLGVFTTVSAIFLVFSLYTLSRSFFMGNKVVEYLKPRFTIPVSAVLIFLETIFLIYVGPLRGLFIILICALLWYLLLIGVILFLSLLDREIPLYLMGPIRISGIYLSLTVLLALLYFYLSPGSTHLVLLSLLLFSISSVILWKIRKEGYGERHSSSLTLKTVEGAAAVFLSAAVIFLSLTGFLRTVEGITLYHDFLLYFSLMWLIMAGILATLSVQHLITSSKLTRWVGGRIVEQTMASGQGPLLKSPTLGISGRPDAVVVEGGHSIPVEIKYGRIPRGPFFSHIMQLAAYLYMMRETVGDGPSYGYIRYISRHGEQKDFRVDWDGGLERLLKKMVKEIREAEEGVREVHRNHRRAGKCAHCSRRGVCPERLT